MSLNEGDVVKNDNFKCKYGIILESITISFYARVFQVATETGIYTWDDNDTKFVRTLKLSDSLREKAAPNNKWLFGYINYADNTIVVRRIGVASLTMTLENFLRDFDVSDLEGKSENYRNYSSCTHDFKPWPFDMHRRACKHCGEWQ